MASERRRIRERALSISDRLASPSIDLSGGKDAFATWRDASAIVHALARAASLDRAEVGQLLKLERLPEAEEVRNE